MLQGFGRSGVSKLDPESGTVEETTSLEAIADLVFVIPVHVRAQLLQHLTSLARVSKLLLKLASVWGHSSKVHIIGVISRTIKMPISAHVANNKYVVECQRWLEMVE